MAAGTAMRFCLQRNVRKAVALRSIPPSACSKDCSNMSGQDANRRPSLRRARGPKTICSSAAMLRSLRTGEIIDKRWLRFSFPTFWHHDVLRGLDYLRNAGIKPDGRAREAIKTPDRATPPERAVAAQPPSCRTYPLEMETDVGSASRSNTLRALRVSRW
jgi:hypothetical protein